MGWWYRYKNINNLAPKGLLDSQVAKYFLHGPFLLTWINFDPSIDK